MLSVNSSLSSIQVTSQFAISEMWFPVGVQIEPTPLPSLPNKKSPKTKSSKLKIVSSVNLKLKTAMTQNPKEFRLQTGKLAVAINTLEIPSTEQLLNAVYPNYSKVSFNQKMSLEMCLGKLIQRTRVKIQKFGLSISFNKETKRWSLITIEESVSLAS